MTMLKRLAQALWGLYFEALSGVGIADDRPLSLASGLTTYLNASGVDMAPALLSRGAHTEVVRQCLVMSKVARCMSRAARELAENPMHTTLPAHEAIPMVSALVMNIT
jgi:hypothetical protein